MTGSGSLPRGVTHTEGIEDLRAPGLDDSDRPGRYLPVVSDMRHELYGGDSVPEGDAAAAHSCRLDQVSEASLAAP